MIYIVIISQQALIVEQTRWKHVRHTRKSKIPYERAGGVETVHFYSSVPFLCYRSLIIHYGIRERERERKRERERERESEKEGGGRQEGEKTERKKTVNGKNSDPTRYFSGERCIMP